MQLFQTPDTVVILNEMVHNARIVPLDGRRHVGQDIKLWLGDSPDEVLPVMSPEPFDDDFTVETLAESFAGRKAPVKALLLEQSVACVLGTLYAD